MSRQRYDSGDEYYEDGQYDYEDENDDEPMDNLDDEDYEYFQQEENIAFLPPTKWRRIKLGSVILDVSNKGVIKPKDSLFGANKGSPYLGTPYRTYVIEPEPGVRKEYFVHDIVWRAFNGDPPEGWEVRHTFEEACKHRKYYDNALRNLTITPATVEVRPRIFST